MAKKYTFTEFYGREPKRFEAFKESEHPRDAKGRFREVYHGTNTLFDKPKDGSYWTSNKNAARVYFKDHPEGYIHVGQLSPSAQIASLKGESDELVKEFFRRTNSSIENFGHFIDLVEQDEFREFLRKKGFHAIEFSEDSAMPTDKDAVTHNSIVPLTPKAIKHSHIVNHKGERVTAPITATVKLTAAEKKQRSKRESRLQVLRVRSRSDEQRKSIDRELDAIRSNQWTPKTQAEINPYLY